MEGWACPAPPPLTLTLDDVLLSEELNDDWTELFADDTLRLEELPVELLEMMVAGRAVW